MCTVLLIIDSENGKTNYYSCAMIFDGNTQHILCV